MSDNSQTLENPDTTDQTTKQTAYDSWGTTGMTEDDYRKFDKNRKEFGIYIKNHWLGLIIFSPVIAAIAVAGVALGAAAFVATSPVTVPLAAGYALFKISDKILTPFVKRRREKALEKAIHQGQMEEARFKAELAEKEAELEAEAEADPEVEQPPAPEPEQSIELTPEELKPGITQYEPTGRDFSRVSGHLDHFTSDIGAPEYKELQFAFRDVSQDGKLRSEIIGSTVWGVTQIHLFHTQPEFRGQGVGTNLISLAEEFAKNNHGAKTVYLWTPSFQGEGFYEKVGYEEIDRAALSTDTDMNGEPQYHITYKKDLYPDLAKEALAGNYEKVAYFAKQYPGNFLSQLDDIAEQDPDLGEGLTPFFTETPDVVLDVDDIRSRIGMSAAVEKARRDMQLSSERMAQETDAKLSKALKEITKKIEQNIRESEDRMAESGLDKVPENTPAP